jgi:hypothetical protein
MRSTMLPMQIAPQMKIFVVWSDIGHPITDCSIPGALWVTRPLSIGPVFNSGYIPIIWAHSDKDFCGAKWYRPSHHQLLPIIWGCHQLLHFRRLTIQLVTTACSIDYWVCCQSLHYRSLVYPQLYTNYLHGYLCMGHLVPTDNWEQ